MSRFAARQPKGVMKLPSGPSGRRHMRCKVMICTP